MLKQVMLTAGGEGGVGWGQVGSVAGFLSTVQQVLKSAAAGRKGRTGGTSGLLPLLPPQTSSWLKSEMHQMPASIALHNYDTTAMHSTTNPTLALAVEGTAAGRRARRVHSIGGGAALAHTALHVVGGSGGHALGAWGGACRGERQ